MKQIAVSTMVVIELPSFSLDPSALVGLRLSAISPWKTVLLVASILTGACLATVGVGFVVFRGGGFIGGLGID